MFCFNTKHPWDRGKEGGKAKQRSLSSPDSLQTMSAGKLILQVAEGVPAQLWEQRGRKAKINFKKPKTQ